MRVKLVNHSGEGPPPHQWVDKETNKLARHGALTQNEKATSYEYYCQLYNIVDPNRESAPKLDQTNTSQSQSHH